jgi:hypothetical protein
MNPAQLPDPSPFCPRRCSATALLYIVLRTRHGTQWDALVREAKVTLTDYRESGRYFDDDDLQAAWELFEARDYEPALTRALTAVARDEARPVDCRPDPQPYEIGCMILRRRSRLEEELDLLRRYFRRRLGNDVTVDEIRALSPVFNSRRTLALRPMDDLCAAVARRRPRPCFGAGSAVHARYRALNENENSRNSEARLARACEVAAEDAYGSGYLCPGDRRPCEQWICALS